MKRYSFKTRRILLVPRRVPENCQKTHPTHPSRPGLDLGQLVHLHTLFEPMDGWRIQVIGMRHQTIGQLHHGNGERSYLQWDKRMFQTYDTRQESLDVDGNGHCTDTIAWWSDVDWEFADPKLWHSSMEDGWRVCAAGNTCNQGTPQVQSATTGWEAAAMDDGCRNNASINRPCSLRNSGGLHVENCGEQLCA